MGAIKARWVFPDDSRKWNAYGGITALLEDEDLMIAGAFAIKRVNTGEGARRSASRGAAFVQFLIRLQNSFGAIAQRATAFSGYTNRQLLAVGRHQQSAKIVRLQQLEYAFAVA